MAPALPFIAAGAAVVGAGASVASGIMGANAQAGAAEAQKKAAEAQAHFADLSAQDAVNRGATEAGRIRTQGSQTISAQRAAYAGAGVDVDTGTAANVQASTRAMSEYDALTAKVNAAREAWGLSQDATALRLTGQHALQAGQNQATGSILGGIGGSVQGLGNAALILRDRFQTPPQPAAQPAAKT